MTAKKMQARKRRRSPKRSGRKSDLPIATTELEPREDLIVRAGGQQGKR